MGFSTSKSDPSLFIPQGRIELVILLPYVDDLVIAGAGVDDLVIAEIVLRDKLNIGRIG